MFDAHTVIGAVEALPALAWEIKHAWKDIPKPTQRLIEEGRSYDLAQYTEAAAIGEQCRRMLPDIFAEDEIILTLQLPAKRPKVSRAPAVLSSTDFGHFSIFHA